MEEDNLPMLTLVVQKAVLQNLTTDMLKILPNKW